MTEHIRWEDVPVGGSVGFTGTLEAPVLHIWQPPQASGEWVLTTELPGIEGKRCYGATGELKAEAEKWLEEFVSSLGATFPTEPAKEEEGR